GAATALIDLERRAPLFVHKALYWDEAMPTLPCVFLITTTGGILQGDRFHTVVNLAPETQVHLTTQSSTQIHSMDANYAAQTQEIHLGDNAYLEYLPDPICPHAHARFFTHTHVTIAATATMLYAETLMAGRKYHKGGEVFQFDVFSSTVQVERPDSQQLLTEKFVIEPKQQAVRQTGQMKEFDVFGNVLLLTPKMHADAIFAQTPASYDRNTGVAAGASRLPNDAGLIYKVLGRETQPVQAKIREFWAIVRQTVVGAPIMPKFLWR
ncbi:urease accessory protein UreD, partial [Caldilinea sp.]|uniref:urease accessory protein UreD n=1 Tax=Caldilinea sp. TaxID=2293560 RepID=UPI002C39EC9A|nr:urease accessory protein UreD [Caldilinea sp.]